MKADQEKSTSPAARVFRFYYEGFTTLSSWGRKVWIIILVKLFIIFAILKIFFFPDFLKKNFVNDEQRSEYVLDKLTNTPVADD
jgi:Domain of unknown function (DUF4492)